MFVITHVDIGCQGTNAADLLRKLAEASRKEEGNVRFDVLQHAMRANHFAVIEEWQSAKAADTHAAAAHTKEYRNSLGPIAGGPLDERLYRIVEQRTSPGSPTWAFEMLEHNVESCYEIPESAGCSVGAFGRECRWSEDSLHFDRLRRAHDLLDSRLHMR